MTGIDPLVRMAMIGLVATPLAIWKLVDIVIWICRHLHWSWS